MRIGGILRAACCALFCTGAFATEAADFGTHRFGDYPAKIYKGRLAKPDFVRFQQFSGYRTRIRHGSARGVNFAGHYAIVQIGCGTGCATYYLVDVANGAIIMLPLGGGEHRTAAELIVRPNSRLLKARWEDYQSDYSPICRLNEYLFNGQTLLPQWQESKTGECPY